jgi:hypothetical protein
MLVGMDDDAEVHAVHRRIPAINFTLRSRSLGFAVVLAVLTPSSERLSQSITSASEVTNFSIPSFMSAGIFGPVKLRI